MIFRHLCLHVVGTGSSPFALPCQRKSANLGEGWVLKYTVARHCGDTISMKENARDDLGVHCWELLIAGAGRIFLFIFFNLWSLVDFLCSGDGPTPIYIWATLTELSRFLKKKKKGRREERREEGKEDLKLGRICGSWRGVSGNRFDYVSFYKSLKFSRIKKKTFKTFSCLEELEFVDCLEICLLELP